jgi:hypothetical protein
VACAAKPPCIFEPAREFPRQTSIGP